MKTKHINWFTDRIGKTVLMTKPNQEPVQIKIEGWTHARLLHQDYQIMEKVWFEDLPHSTK